jgi:hypothetical protein
MRKLASIAVSVCLIVAGLPPRAYAAPPADNPCPLSEAGVYQCPLSGIFSSSATQAGTSSTPGGGGAGAPSGVVYVPHKRISVDSNGNPCIETIYIPAGTPARPDFGLPETEQGPGGVSGLYETAPPCPVQSAAPESGSAVTPLIIALNHWARVPLPRPKPWIAPGRAITGKPAYLETQGSVAYTYRSDTVFGVLEIVAHGSHYVDWGDGVSTGPYTTGGSPWPKGNIVHEYQDVGVFDVVVTTKWVATWRLATDRGELAPTETTGRLEAFPVHQIQAVIGR